ncbi:17969_t:CDS:1 [Rhizophagus irregularis]|nr:17969_t:CDS:1 [Rhizophagus irregularis]
MAKDICEGKRPPVPPGTPSFYSELMKSCWDANPNNRPNAPEVLKTVYHWLVNDSLDEYLRKGGSTILFNGSSSNLTHPEAVYYSRLLEFPELRKPNLQNSSVEENNNNYLRPPLTQEISTQSPRGTLNSSKLKLRSSRETLESKISQSTYTSKQSRATYNNKPQDTSNSRPVPSKTSQRTSGKVSQRKYNSNSPKPSNYSRPSQNSSYSNSQSTVKPPQRSPMSPSQFYESARSVKSDDSVSVNSKALENPLSVIIPDDDIATLTSFWSMDGPNLNTIR